MKSGEVEGSGKVGIGGVVGDLRVFLIFEGNLDLKGGVARGDGLVFLGNDDMRPGAFTKDHTQKAGYKKALHYLYLNW